MRVFALLSAGLVVATFAGGGHRRAPQTGRGQARAAGPVAGVLARMQERYDKASDYRAKFTQKYTSGATGRERTSTGELFIKKPGRMRLSYQTPDAQHVSIQRHDVLESTSPRPSRPSSRT